MGLLLRIEDIQRFASHRQHFSKVAEYFLFYFCWQRLSSARTFSAAVLVDLVRGILIGLLADLIYRQSTF